MPRLIGAVAVVCALALSATTANARKSPRHNSTVPSQCVWTNSGRVRCLGPEKRTESHRKATDANGNDARPSAWCGWWMRRHLGVSDRAGNLARWWARYGTNAHGPAVGALVVWRHHIGIITGRGEKDWIVLSGNDGGKVRERERSVARAIAFRWPHRMAGL